MSDDRLSIGVARGCTGCTFTPRAKIKKLGGGDLYGKVVSASPDFFEEIGEIWTVGEVI